MFTLPSEAIQISIRQINRWIIAAEQDRDPRVKNLHSDYAVGNIDLLRELVSDIEIARVTGIGILELRHRALKLQDEAQNTLNKYLMY